MSPGNMNPVKGVCPLGMKACEYIEDNTLHRCNWYTAMRGANPQTGEETEESRCAIAWLPVTHVEVANASRGSRDACVDLRNQIALPVKQFMEMAVSARKLGEKPE